MLLTLQVSKRTSRATASRFMRFTFSRLNSFKFWTTVLFVFSCHVSTQIVELSRAKFINCIENDLRQGKRTLQCFQYVR